MCIHIFSVYHTTLIDKRVHVSVSLFSLSFIVVVVVEKTSEPSCVQFNIFYNFRIFPPLFRL